MPDVVDLSGRPFHFIGIGGIGMSALAHILVERGLPVSGSDARRNHITQKLQGLGTHIVWRQDGEYLAQLRSQAQVLPQVIRSTAIHADNPEYQAAVEMGCPIYHRSDVLAALIAEAPDSIAVAGTHGKTTTSSLLGYILFAAQVDPTIVVGGEVAAWAGNARTGRSSYLVAEADESDGSLVNFRPNMGIITNIELDHPDHYTSLGQVVGIFQTFVNRCQMLVACLDCPTIRDRLLPANPDKKILTYSLRQDSGADYTVDQVRYEADGTTAFVYERGTCLGEFHVKLLGAHNLSNTLAAIAITRHIGLDFPVVAQAIGEFQGARRRFENRGEAQGICFIDDYAHHPSEIKATLASAQLQVQPHQQQANKFQRVVAIFQPHRYSRTHTFLQEFSTAFDCADQVVITDIYSAGEADTGLISGEQVAAAIANQYQGTGTVAYQPTLANVTEYLQTHLRTGDLVMFLGAGNLNRIIPETLAHFQAAEVQSLSQVALP